MSARTSGLHTSALTSDPHTSVSGLPSPQTHILQSQVCPHLRPTYFSLRSALTSDPHTSVSGLPSPQTHILQSQVCPHLRPTYLLQSQVCPHLRPTYFSLRSARTSGLRVHAGPESQCQNSPTGRAASVQRSSSACVFDDSVSPVRPGRVCPGGGDIMCVCVPLPGDTPCCAARGRGRQDWAWSVVTTM